MSSDDNAKTNLLVPNAPLNALGYILAVRFHEPMKLIRQRGMDFGAKLATHINPRVVDLQENSWTFSQPLGDTPDGLFRVTIQDQTVELEAKLPNNKLEWVETNFGIILKEFQKTFNPAVLISSVARVVKTVSVDGDARSFLLEHVAHIPVERLNPLHRPIHLIGLHLGCPPFFFQEPGGGEPIQKEWAVDVKVESLAADVSKVFIDATGQWPLAAKMWNDEATNEAVQRLATVNEFLEKDVLGFLTDDQKTGAE